MLFESTNDTGNVRSLLADSNVNADYVLAFLVKDGVNSNGSFAGAAVADNKFALATSDRNESVDTFNTGLKRSIYGFTVSNAVCRRFNRAFFSISNAAFAVDRFAQRAYNAAEEAFAYANFHDASGSAYDVAFFNKGIATKQYNADVFTVKVKYHAGYAVRKFNHFACHSVFHTDNGSDAVTDFFNNADFFKVYIHCVILELSAHGIGDFGSILQGVFMNVNAIHYNFHFSQLTQCGSIEYFIANLYYDAAEDSRVNNFIHVNFAAQFLGKNCRNGLILGRSQFFSSSNFDFQQFFNGTAVNFEIGQFLLYQSNIFFILHIVSITSICRYKQCPKGRQSPLIRLLWNTNQYYFIILSTTEPANFSSSAEFNFCSRILPAATKLSLIT